MKLVVIGLGRMGRGIARRLSAAGHTVGGYDPDPSARNSVGTYITLLDNYHEIHQFFGTERKLLWIMVPHTVVDDVLEHLLPLLSEGDVVVDGGNSHYLSSQARHHRLKEKGVYFLDVGVSGGVYGEEEGYCLMVGGEEDAFLWAEEVFRDLAYRGKGYAYLGPSGAGHYAKMVHNGIEYAMMEAIGEGFELLKESPFRYDLAKVARLYNEGSVIRSWLMELTQKVFQEEGELEDIQPYVEDTGEGRWTILEAIQRGLPAPAIALALFMRFRSRQNNSFRDRLLAALRYQFGRHTPKRRDG
ncbi:6-phosphogluconate dehydrogenase, decarboxylating [Thermocrinis albus DSM 14484]|uniref:6-phosphogluconate dehydrogenase, decarboxylating n=1 Tax=Thermocrinis albus (strain DSM 14484 / JCM 11386 / HI 11/12) TaxID=638303 RepID=D3SN78_THEAH|nr:decarboxylating 6-phosphogluconate dehydrogenase [Thermocrinis albus]ADC90208.1 6-phosphogluconate dehydrogenase, decarboxylating [Thermocrinis albus DSM 14484]